MKYLLDTNVISELRKGPRCDANVARWFDEVADDALFLSVMVVGEIRCGIARIAARDPVKTERLERWLDGLIGHYGDRILPVDLKISDLWGRLNHPQPLPAVDGLMAATAAVHGLTLVTRNTSDVERTGVALLNPFLT